MRKKIVAFLIVFVFFLVACSPQEDEMIGYINQSRRSYGVRELSINIDLYLKAQAWAGRMAREQYLRHSNLAEGNGYNWVRLGENVGHGPNMATIQYLFMNSPSHRENILAPYWTSMGIGVVQDRNGVYWVAQEFMQEAR